MRGFPTLFVGYPLEVHFDYLYQLDYHCEAGKPAAEDDVVDVDIAELAFSAVGVELLE